MPLLFSSSQSYSLEESSIEIVEVFDQGLTACLLPQLIEFELLSSIFIKIDLAECQSLRNTGITCLDVTSPHTHSGQGFVATCQVGANIICQYK